METREIKTNFPSGGKLADPKYAVFKHMKKIVIMRYSFSANGNL